MDLEIAEPTADTSMSRRSLVTRAGAAGLAGVAAAFVIDRSSLASAAGPDERPGVPTESDMALLSQVMGLELAIGELYGMAAEGADEELATLAGVMASNHRAYAEAIAGATGISAGVADPELVADNLEAFSGSTTEALTSAHAIEQTAVSTHTSLIGEYQSSHAIALTASIAVVEARHATVLADLLDVDDFDVLFGNDQPPLELTGDDA